MDEMNMSGEVDGRLYTASCKEGRITVYNHGVMGDGSNYYSMTIPGSAEDFLQLPPESPDRWFQTVADLVRGREQDFKRF